jgi:DNA primase large subunit
MFEKLFLIVKNNAGMAVVDNPEILEKDRDAVINDASSSIIEVFKGQMESGKLKDLVKYFQYPEIYKSPLTTSVINKFANKLNRFYNINPTSALNISKSLIPPVMLDLIEQTKGGKNKEFTLSSFLSKINGNRADLSALVNRLMLAS